MSFYKRRGKRAFDVTASAAALIVLSPLLALVALAVAAKLGRPVLFRQSRTGFARRPFDILKLRSMLDAVDADGHALPDDQRLTRFGVWLRSTSLDELPGLVNILRGEMSVVGPRPFVHVYDPLYSPQQARRFDVRPGITGWAQVNGRNAIGWPEKLALDSWYVDNQSFALDLRIIAMTLRKVFVRHGINDAGGAPVLPFRGETAVRPGFDPGATYRR